MTANVELIVGKIGTGKTYELARRARNAMKKGEPVYWIVSNKKGDLDSFCNIKRTEFHELGKINDGLILIDDEFFIYEEMYRRIESFHFSLWLKEEENKATILIAQTPRKLNYDILYCLKPKIVPIHHTLGYWQCFFKFWLPRRTKAFFRT